MIDIDTRIDVVTAARTGIVAIATEIEIATTTTTTTTPAMATAAYHAHRLRRPISRRYRTSSTSTEAAWRMSEIWAPS